MLIKLPSWDMYDSDNKLASISISWRNQQDAWQNLLYLRKDILDKFLKQKKLKLVWAFWGGREIRMTMEELNRKKNKTKYLRKEFQQIFYYNKGQIFETKKKK